MSPIWQKLAIASLCGSAFAGWTAHHDDPRLFGLCVWLLSLVVLVAAGILHDLQGSRAPSRDGTQPALVGDRWTRADWLGVAALTLMALGLRLYRLGNALPPVHGDEAEMGMLALLVLHGPSGGPPLLPFGVGFFGQPALFHYPQAVGMQIFGESITSLRMLSVLAGTLCVPAVYSIGRIAWGRVAGLLAGWLLATSQLHIHFSRIALNNIETVLGTVIVMSLLLLLERAGRRKAQAAVDRPAAVGADVPLLLPIAIGLVIGLAQYFYFGSRLLPVIALILFAVLWRQRLVTLRQLCFVSVGFAVAILPLAVFYIDHWPAFTGRMTGVSVFSAPGIAHALGADARWPDDLGWLLWRQLSQNLLFFLGHGDRSTFYSAEMPSFDAVTIALFWFGLVLMVARANRFPEIAILLWLGLGTLLGGVVTNDPPNAPRLIVVVPAVCLIGGVFAQWLTNAIAALKPSVWRRSLAAAAGVLPAAALGLNASDYFIRYPQVYAPPVATTVAETVAAGARTDRYYFLGAPVLFATHGVLRFIAREAEISDLTRPEQLADELSRRSDCKWTTIIALYGHLDDLLAIENLYPGGMRVTYLDRYGAPMFATYRLPNAETDCRTSGVATSAG